MNKKKFLIKKNGIQTLTTVRIWMWFLKKGINGLNENSKKIECGSITVVFFNLNNNNNIKSDGFLSDVFFERREMIEWL